MSDDSGSESPETEDDEDRSEEGEREGWGATDDEEDELVDTDEEEEAKEVRALVGRKRKVGGQGKRTRVDMSRNEKGDGRGNDDGKARDTKKVAGGKGGKGKERRVSVTSAQVEDEPMNDGYYDE